MSVSPVNFDPKKRYLILYEKEFLRKEKITEKIKEKNANEQ
jgi:hypothetical protein